MRSKHLLSDAERKSALRQVILRLAPGISQGCLDRICETVNTKRRYFVKSTSDKERFLNLVTREMIVTEDSRTICEVMPLYGSFEAPYFEKIMGKRQSKSGDLDPSFPAAAVKIRAGMENNFPFATYSLIIYLAQ